MFHKNTLFVGCLLTLLLLSGCFYHRGNEEAELSKVWELEEFFIFAGWPHEIDCPDDEAIIKWAASYIQSQFNCLVKNTDEMVGMRLEIEMLKGMDNE